MQVVDVVRLEGGVGFELTLPISLIGLEGQEMRGAALDGPFQPLRPILFRRYTGRRNSNILSRSRERGHPFPPQ